MQRIAVIGSGYWGRNLVRTFYQMIGDGLKYVCDINKEVLERISRDFPAVQTTDNIDQVLSDPEVQAVAIATIAPTHFEIAKKALEAGKHVYVEKPMTLTVEDGEELVKLSSEKQLTLTVGHILVYHPAVRKLKELITSGELGDIYYIYSQRLNLGKVRADENAMWSFAPHDLSVVFYLLEGELEVITATGQSFLRESVEDVVFMNLRFKSGQVANIHLSWLDPHKKRSLTIVGSKKMVVFDDMALSEKLKIYDKGVEFAGDYKSYGEYLSLRFGDIVIPQITMQEPLLLACENFLKSARGETDSLSDGGEGLKVVRALNAAQKSLTNGGTPFFIS